MARRFMMGNYLAIDIGGTYIKYAYLNEQHELEAQQKVKTPVNENQAILKQIESIVQAAVSKDPIKGVGISTAGIVDRDKGEIIYAGPTIKNYRGTAFNKHLTQKFHLPVHVENDVDAALLGEIWQGAGRHQNNIFCITLGTGIGGAYFNNKLIDGINSQANSVGYMLYDDQTETNYEMRASTTALNNLISRKFGDRISTKDVFAQAKNGDHQCLTILTTWAKEVAKGLAQIIILIDPQTIIIGGGISAQGPFLLDLIKQHVPQYLPEDFLRTELKIATLFNDAALYGAVYPLIKYNPGGNH